MSDRLEPHESGVRKLVSEARGETYEALSCLAEAKQHEDAYVVLEGDDGGQIYAVFPVGSIRCDEPTLERLLEDLDAIAWPGNPPDSAHVFFERHASGEAVIGGMRGGVARPTGWVHGEFEVRQLADQVRQVIAGSRERIRRSGEP